MFTSVSESLFWHRSLPCCVTSCVCLCLCVCLSMHLSLCVILSDCLSTDFAGGQAGRRGWLGCEGEGWCRLVVVRKGWLGGCSITASPEWGSRCKALIAPRSLSLLCDRPLQSCPRPRQLQQDRGCVRDGEKKTRNGGGGEMAPTVASKEEMKTAGSKKSLGGKKEREERKDVYQMRFQLFYDLHTMSILCGITMLTGTFPLYMYLHKASNICIQPHTYSFSG